MRSPRKQLLLLALVGTGFALPALAQKPQSYPAPCDASRVSKGDVDRAHTVFLSGKGFLDESNYDKAISYFTDAYSIDCSVHGILPIIATAYERKGDKAEAIRALEEYVRRAPAATDRDVIERRIRNLKDQLAQEHPTTTAPPPPTTATATATGPVGTVPSATATNTAPVPTAAPTDTGGEHSIAPWLMVGVGGAAVVTGVILFAVGAGDISSAESACPTHSGCSNSTADQGNSGRTLEGVGVAVGAVGLAAVAGGLVWHFVETPTPASDRAPATTLTPVVRPGYAGVSLGGSF